MLKFEKKTIESLEKHGMVLGYIFITIVALLIRYFMRNFKSSDYINFLSPWFDYIKNNGGLKALSNFPGDYNAPYMTIIALLTYIPFNKLWLIKGVSIFFDFTLAISSVLLVKQILNDKCNNKFILLLTYFAVLMLPTVVMNSAMWGQCDSIYATFIILSLFFLFKKKYIYSFIMLGIAFSFKLQFIFILPLYIVIYALEKKYSIFKFLLIPITNFIMCLPAIFFGMPLKKCVIIYAKQTQTYSKYLTLNFPNIYNIIGNKNVDIFYKIGVMITILICFFMLVYLIYKKIRLNNEKIITLALWFLVITTYFLPGMHERYLFVGEIISIIYLVIYRKNLPLVIFINISSMITYLRFLKGLSFEYMQIISIIYGIIIIYFTKNLFNLLQRNSIKE